MFNKDYINKNYVLFYMNYRGYSNADSITLDGFDIKNGRTHNDEKTVDILPINDYNFIPFTITETYYNDVIVYLASINRNDKINKIIK